MRFLVLAFVLSVAGACAHRKVVVEDEPAQVAYACPDDGVHFVDAKGNCLGDIKAMQRRRLAVACPNHGHHVLVKDVCVDLMGK